MSSAIVVRRYKCKSDRMELKHFTIHEGLLQISGPPDSEMLIFSRDLSKLGYRIACNCSLCLSYKEEIRHSGHLPTTEPLVKGLAIIFNILCTFNYDLNSTTTTQNEDGSNTTIWVWIKKKINSEI